MPLMLIVLMVLTVITATLVSTSARDQESARLAAGRTEARLLASSVLEDVFARVRVNPRDAFKLTTSSADLTGTAFDPAAPVEYKALRRGTATNWAVLPTPSRATSSTDSPIDTLYKKDIGTEECPTDFMKDCFYVTVLNPTPAGSTNPGSFTVRVGLRLRCAGVEARCVFAAFEQRLRRAQFYDFALAQQYATLAPEALFEPGSWEPGAANVAAFDSYRTSCSKPGLQRAQFNGSTTVKLGSTDYRIGSTNAGTFTEAAGSEVPLQGCVDIAYQSDDRLADAPVYSGDDYLTVCGNPTFGQVFLAGRGSSPSGANNPWWVKSPSCDLVSNLGGTSNTLNFPVMALPKADLLSSGASSAGLESRSLPTSGPVVIDLGGLGPSSSGVVVTGDGKAGTLDAVVYGTVRGQKSVVVLDGSVAIIGDVKYDAGVAGSDAFSLTASERIEIWQSCGSDGTPEDPEDFATWWDPTTRCIPEKAASTGTPFSRVVHGVLTSPDGFVGVPDWLTNVDEQRTQGKLEFFGSMAAKYQGVFGSFTQQGRLVSGFVKQFSHDKRPTTFVNGGRVGNPAGSFALPPFVVESEVPIWLRLDLSEVAYTGS